MAPTILIPVPTEQLLELPKPKPPPDLLPTEGGNANRLAHYGAGQHVYVPELDWLYWDGTRWATDVKQLKILALAKTLPKRIWNEAEKVPPDNQGTLRKWAWQSDSRARAFAAIDLARPDMQAPLASFDTALHLLGTPSGVVDLRDGTLRPLDPAMRIRIITGAPFDSGAGTPARWLRFLDEVFAGDGALVAWLQVSGLCAHWRDDARDVYDIPWRW